MKATFRCVSEGDVTKMMLVDAEKGKKIASRTISKPKVVGPMRVSYGNTARVRSELSRIARKRGIEII